MKRGISPVAAIVATAAAAALLAACGDDALEPYAGADDAPVEFGLPGKADSAGCDPRAPLCWDEADAAAARQLLAAEDALLFGGGDPQPALAAAVDALEALSHKLDEHELTAFEALRVEAEAALAGADDDTRADFAARLGAQVSGRVLAGYLAAHAVALGHAAELAGGKADSPHPEAPTGAGGGLTPDMRESLRLLGEQGLFAWTYAFLFRHTGVLERDYAPLDEVFPFSEPQESRVRRIVDRAYWATVRAASLANVESLIPFGGIVISVSHGTVMNFRIRARMVLEIAATYGLDIRHGNNLLLAATALVGAMAMPETRAATASAISGFGIYLALARLGRLVRPGLLVNAATLRMLGRALAPIAARGAALATAAAAKQAAQGTGRQVLGYATLGLAMLGDVLFTSWATDLVGRQADVTLRPWGAGMLHAGAEVLADPGARTCATAVLGEVLRADGRLSAAEAVLLAAWLERKVHTGRGWEPLGTNLDALARAAAGRARVDTERCVTDHFVGVELPDRLDLLSWLYTAAAVDGAHHAAELRRYGAWRERLRGGAWIFDGAELNDGDLAAMQARIDALLVDPSAVIDPADLELALELPLEERIAGLDQGTPAATAAVQRAFAP